MATIAAEQMCERVRAWAAGEERVAAAIVYGSVAARCPHELSDLDLVIVARPGEREALWAARESLAEQFLGEPIVFQQEPSWQRPFRLQAWRRDLIEIDLTFDEGNASAWPGLANGVLTLVDRDGVADRLRAELASAEPMELDATFFDAGTWPWLLWLFGRLRHGRCWIVRYGLMDTLNNRVVPLLGSSAPLAERELDAADLARLHEAAPRSADVDELRRALGATAELYDLALDRWASRTGRERPRHPLAPAILELLARV